jgi:ribosomal protein S7
LQKCVDIANPQQQETLLISIAEHTHELITNQYGNYVLQFVLSKRNTSVNEVIVDNILKKIIDYAKQKYSSNVIEKCFEYCEHGLRCKIVNAIKTYESIVTLLFDMYGNYVLQKAITYADDEESKSYFIGIIIKEINKLQEFDFGQKLITKLILTFPELRFAIKKNHKEFNVNIVAICNQIESLTMETTMNNTERFNINMMMNNYNSINNGYI